MRTTELKLGSPTILLVSEKSEKEFFYVHGVVWKKGKDFGLCRGRVWLRSISCDEPHRFLPAMQIGDSIYGTK